MEALKTRLRRLKLVAAAKTLELRNQEALDGRISYLEFLELLLEDELAWRQSRSHELRLKASMLDPTKTLQNYDFSFQGTLDKRRIYDLATCQFITSKKNIVFQGKSGVGKTHLAQAIGLEAVKQGYSVLKLHINQLLQQLQRSRVEGTFRRLMKKMCKVDLLIIDDLGLNPLPAEEIRDFYEIVNNRNENRSLVITTNRQFSDYEQVFGGDSVMASVIIDRILHNAELLKILGDSYRVKDLMAGREETGRVEES